MIRVMFVCHGNICRSPMAEFILKDMLRKHHLEQQILVASSATSTEEIIGKIGNPVYPPAREELARHGIFCEGKRAVQLTRADYNRYDWLIGMDSANIRNMKLILGGDPEGKIHKMMWFCHRDEDVADPWYSGRFDVTYRDIVCGCEGLMHMMKEQLKEKTGKNLV